MNQKQSGQWSLKHERCVKCGTVDRPYFSKGMCQPCYFSEYNPIHASKIAQQKRNWWMRNGGIEWSRIQREQLNYGGMRQAALERDGFKCVQCSTTEQLTVHHKDGNGRGKDNPNNVLDNLETLCRKHHLLAHRAELKAARARALNKKKGRVNLFHIGQT